MHKGKPLAGVGVGYVTVNRVVGGGPAGRTHYFDRAEIATDNRGRFLFSNVNADDDLYVYGLMNSLKTYGAVPIHQVKTGSDGVTTDVGDLVVEEAHKLSGRIVLDDGGPVPPHTRVLISREQAWDTQTIELDEDGRFEAMGLPTEQMTLSSVIRGIPALAPERLCQPLEPGIGPGPGRPRPGRPHDPVREGRSPVVESRQRRPRVPQEVPRV